MNKFTDYSVAEQRIIVGAVISAINDHSILNTDDKKTVLLNFVNSQVDLS